MGEWVKFPTTAEELKEVFKRIGIGQKDDFGQPYEEWFITDYDCYVDGLYSKLGEYENLDELNYLASKLDEMSESEYAQFQAGMEMGDHCGSLQEIINLTENLDCYEIYPNIEDYDDLGRYYLEELEVSKVPAHLQNYIDYEAYGRDVALEENGTFTDQGYVRDTRETFHEYYDGERGSIPEEYRVMTFQDDLPEEEKSEWAMDIAFDMDEFFRQNDPQYAAEHPEAHAAKEQLYENLKEEPPAVCSCTKKCEAGAVNTACPVCVTDKSKCTGKAPEPPAETPEPEKEKPAGLNPAALILLLALLGGGGVFAYLKLVKNKPKTKGNDSLDDYDYGEEDSEEWETEDEEVLEDGFEGSDPNEERDRAD